MTEMIEHHSAPDEARRLQDLMRLTPLTPDPARARRVRARCHAALARRQRRSRRMEPVADFVQRVAAPSALGVLCLLYTIVFFVLALGNGQSSTRPP